MVVVIVCDGGCMLWWRLYTEVMVIYVWQCMVVLLYDCICAQWLWSIYNEGSGYWSGCQLSKII